MYKTLVTILIVSISCFGYSQNIGVNVTGTAPLASAMLDVSSTDKGLLVPRVNIIDLSTALPVATPATSLLVFNTNAASGVGYYFWDATKWTQLSDANSNPDNDWYEVGGTSSPNSIWDDIFTRGNVGIGTTAPSVDLSILNTVSPSVHLRRDASNEWYFTATPVGNDRLCIRAGGNSYTNEKLSILTSGNVGIGTVAPAYKLDVKDYSFRIGHILSTDDGVVKTSYLGTSAGFEYLEFDDPFILRGIQTGLNDGDTALLSFYETNIGVGTAYPTERLEVQGSIKIVDGTEGAGKVLTSDAAGVGSWVSSGSAFYQSMHSGRTNVVGSLSGTYTYTTNNITLPEAGTYLIFTTSHITNAGVASWFNVDYSTSSTVFTDYPSTPSSCADWIDGTTGNRNFTNMNVVVLTGATTLYQWVRASLSSSWTSYGNGNDGESTIIAIKLN